MWEKLVFPPSKRLLEGAFPSVDFDTFASVRPGKAPRRARKGKDAPTPTPEPEEPVKPVLGSFVATPANRFVVVRATAWTSLDPVELDELVRACSRYPGEKAVVIQFETHLGIMRMDTNITVSPCDEFFDAVARIGLAP
jgi:hypothetical protein